MGFRTLLAGSAVLAWLLSAQPALGATVGVFEDFNLEHEIRYEAVFGEINNVRVLEPSDGTYVISDLAATITPLTGCTSISPNEVRCEVGSGNDDRANVLTKDGADIVYVNSDAASVHGGAGPDTLTAGRGGGSLLGGLGDDRLVGLVGKVGLSGGQGADSLEGGPDDDELDGGPGTDVIAGGPGEDTVSYFDHTKPVRITLDGRANDGSAGENDWVRADVESADGSIWSPTTFIGNAKSNTFVSYSDDGDVVRARAGNDWVFTAGVPCFCAGDGPRVVQGGAGDDHLEGGKGRNVLLGGPGADVLDGYGGADVIRGARGNDFLNGYSGADHLDGGRGKDRLSAGPQNDILRGGPGRDHLLGNAGADVFYARDRNRDRLSGGPGPDRARVDFIDGFLNIEAFF